MKLIVAIVQDQDETLLNHAFLEEEVRATKLSSTGSFLKSGNTTFLIGVEDNQVERVLGIISDHCSIRQQYVSSPTNYDVNLDLTASFPIEVEIGGAIVFVLPIESFHRF